MPRPGSGLALVARGTELDRLRAALDRARNGEPSGVLLSGEAGVGKSRLLEELSSPAVAGDALVLTGRCLDVGESGLPYLPFAEALAAVPEPAVRKRPALGGLVPGTGAAPAPETRQETGFGAARRSGDAVSSAVTGAALADALPAGLRAIGVRPEPDLTRLRLFDAVHGLLGELAESRPVLLALEDLHWADGSTRDLLRYLIARLRRQRLLVVATYRSDDLHRRHPLRPLLAELFRLPAVERLDLRPFSPDDARRFAAALAGGGVPEPVVAEVARRSEGNAFFAEELVAAYHEWDEDTGRASAGPWTMPSALADVLLSRIERLSPDAQQVARAASVAGRRVRYSRLSAAAGLPEPELEAALRELVQHNVLVASGGDQMYAYRHALSAEAVYGELLAGERIRLHAAYARALEAERDRPGAAAELAHHALRSNDLPRALRASVRAAAEAEAASAPAEALRHLEQAIELWEAVPEEERPGAGETAPGRPADDGLQAGAGVPGTGLPALLGRARGAAGSAGDPERALAYSRAVVRLADEQGDRYLAAEARQDLAARLNAIDGLEREAVDVIEQGLRLIREHEPTPVAARLLTLRAAVQRWMGDVSGARESVNEAIRIARIVEAAAPEADALITLAVLDENAGRPEEAYRNLMLARDRAVAADAPAVELRALLNLGISRSDQGRLAEAREHFAEGVRRAGETGLALTLLGLNLRIHAATSAYTDGDWDADPEAEALPDEVLSPLADTMLAAAGLARRVGRGEFDEAGARIARLRAERHSDVMVTVHTAAAGAELETWLGRPAQALEHVQDGLHRFEEQFGEPWMLAGIRLAALGVAACADLAEQARRRRDHAGEESAKEEGRAFLRHAREAARRGTPRGAELGPEGRAWLARAEAEADRIDGGAGDPALWEEAVAAFGYGHRYEQANARRRLAAALPAVGRRDEAVPVLQAAARAADELRAAPLADAVRRLATRARLSLAAPTAGGSAHSAAESPSSTASSGQGGLTPRELAVLREVALGRTNRQVGEALYISEKTVSVHLSRAMAKLGVSSRAEAVAAGYERGLLTPRS